MVSWLNSKWLSILWSTFDVGSLCFILLGLVLLLILEVDLLDDSLEVVLLVFANRVHLLLEVVQIQHVFVEKSALPLFLGQQVFQFGDFALLNVDLGLLFFLGLLDLVYGVFELSE